VGMVGISGFGAEQLMAAKLNPSHLKAIFPFDPRGAYGEAGGFRDEYPGGVIHLFRFLLQVYASAHQQKGQPKPLAPEREKLWQEAIANPDFKMYPHVYNVLALKGQHFPAYFDILIDPYDKEAAVEKSEAEFSKITVPARAGTATPTRPTSTAHRTGFATSRRRTRSFSSLALPISTGRSRRSTMKCCVGTTNGSKESTPEF